MKNNLEEAHKVEVFNLNVFTEMIKSLSDEDLMVLTTDLDEKLTMAIEELEKRE